MYEKKISPKNRKIEIKAEKNRLKFKIYRAKVDKIKEIKVPDHVFFGLILGKIKGPLILEPNKKATVSLKNEMPIIK